MDLSTLPTLLNHLHSDDSKSIFLRQLYSPGKTELADFILTNCPRQKIWWEAIGKEIDFAKEHRQEERFLRLARRYLDGMVDDNYLTHTPVDNYLTYNHVDTMIEKWNHPALTEYAFTLLAEKCPLSPEKQDLMCLESAASIALQAGKKEEGTALIERMLQHYQKGEFGNPHLLAEKCRRAGWHQQAIDLYLQAGYRAYEKALSTALLHVPERAREIAEKGFNEYDEDDNDRRYSYDQSGPSFYLACAGILGKVEEARARLLKPAARKTGEEAEPGPQPEDFFGSSEPAEMSSPGAGCPPYPEIPSLNKIQALVNLGEQNAAGTQVERARKDCDTFAAAYDNRHSYDEFQQFGELYEALGEKDKAQEMYRAEIDGRDGRLQLNIIGELENPEGTLARIDEIYKTMKEPFFLEKKLEFFELTTDYEEAAGLATELGKAELAGTYRTMQQLVAEAQQ